MSLELTLKNDDEITLPASIAGSSLTLAEIGAVAVLACLQNGEEIPARINSDEMQDAMFSLKDKGVFRPSFADGKVIITVDLEAVGL